MMPRESPAPSLLISLVLHALAVATIVSGIATPPGGRDAAAALAPPPQTMTFRLVELPETAPAEPDAPTELVSERGSRAADRGPRELPEGEPFNPGETSLPEVEPGEGAPAAAPEAPAAAGEEAPPPDAGAETPEPRVAGAPEPEPPGAGPAPEPEPPAEGDAAAASPSPGLAAGAAPAERAAATAPRLRPLGDPRLEIPRRDPVLPPPRPAGSLGRPGLPQVDNRLSRARYEGEFSLSTYAWDYAPYMRRLKTRIEDYTWTILPSAFWYGIAAWATQVRFTILPDGTLESVAIVGHDGVLDLRHVAPDAVSGAARYEPLPPGFPEPKLTVTGSFYFNVFPPGREPDPGARAPDAAASAPNETGRPR